MFIHQGNNTIWHYVRDNERERNIEIWMERDYSVWSAANLTEHFENSIDSKIHCVQF